MTKPGKALGVTTRYFLVSNLKPCQAIKKPACAACCGGRVQPFMAGIGTSECTGGDGEIHGEQGLLDKLEQSLSLPLPKAGWEF